MDQSEAYICVQGGTGTLWGYSMADGTLHYGNHKLLIYTGYFGIRWWKWSMRTFHWRKENEVYKIVTNFEELTAALEHFWRSTENRNLPAKA
jgi:hypothetical protein